MTRHIVDSRSATPPPHPGRRGCSGSRSACAPVLSGTTAASSSRCPTAVVGTRSDLACLLASRRTVETAAHPPPRTCATTLATHLLAAGTNLRVRPSASATHPSRSRSTSAVKSFPASKPTPAAAVPPRSSTLERPREVQRYPLPRTFRATANDGRGSLAARAPARLASCVRGVDSHPSLGAAVADE